LNFLAHLWLADRTGTSLPGAVLGDVVRGRDLSAYPEPLAQGIRLHRRIDAATDRHPGIAALRAGFAPGQRRYAGIVLDLAGDHALALDWARHHPLPLEQFCGAAARRRCSWKRHRTGSSTPAAARSARRRSRACCCPMPSLLASSAPCSALPRACASRHRCWSPLRTGRTPLPRCAA
jgi:acyl carrier protein phosphodiesterase